MSDDVVIKARNVSKKFCRSLKYVMYYGVQDIARNSIGLSSHSDKLRNGEFWAINDVSFELRRGETFGIIGPNGAGKSTLLKLINGIFMPDNGYIEMKGRVGALIEVGAGFHPMLTGRENIYVNGTILGMSRKEIDRKFDKIVDFADIGDFIDAPVKHYSSGMNVRLGFSIAAHCEPDILLVDEVLSVGDINFQGKCIRRMKQFLAAGTTILFVSHNIRAVQDLCQRAILLNCGIIASHGRSYEVLKDYVDLISRLSLESTASKTTSWALLPDKKVHVTRVVCLTPEGEETDTHYMRNPLHIRIFFKISDPVDQADFQVTIYTQDNITICCCSTKLAGLAPFSLNQDGVIDLIIDEELMPGVYTLRGAIIDPQGGEVLDVWGTTDDRFINFQVASSVSEGGAFWSNLGIVNLRQKWLLGQTERRM